MLFQDGLDLNRILKYNHGTLDSELKANNHQQITKLETEFSISKLERMEVLHG